LNRRLLLGLFHQLVHFVARDDLFARFWRSAFRPVIGLSEIGKGKGKAEFLMGCIGRLDGDRSRPLQAVDEVAVDVEFATATEPKTFGGAISGSERLGRSGR
jgi:hypothetical protein